MIKSPLRTSFILAITFALLGILFSYIESRMVSRNIIGNINELRLARYYTATGQADKAIQEYKSIIDGDDGTYRMLAYQELGRLLIRQSESTGVIHLRLNYLAWYMAPRFYILSGLFAAIWFILIPITIILRNQKLVILPFVDLTGENIGEILPRVAVDRLKQLSWRIANLESKSSIISEILEVPIMGLVDEENLSDVSALVETALNFSGGLINFPLSRLITTIRLWFEQPRFLLRGVLRGSENTFFLDIILIDNSIKKVEKTWRVEILKNETDDAVLKLINGLIFPLLFYFSDRVNARSWVVLESLYSGLEEFYLFEEDGYKISHLKLAKQHLESAVTSDPKYYLAKYNLGLLLLQMGEYEQARDLLRDVAKLSPNEVLVRYANYSYAVALIQLSQEWSHKRAVEVLNGIVNSSDDEQLIYLSRSALAIVYSRMITSREQRYYELAMEEIDALKNSRLANGKVLASAFAAEGYCKMASNSVDESVECFLKAQQLDNKNSAFHVGLGLAYLKKNLKEKAVEEFKRAEIHSPFSLYSSYKLGNIYRDMGDYENAIQAYKRAEGFGLAHLMLGKIYLENHDFENALSEFRSAVSQNKRLIDGWINISWTICEMMTDDEKLLHEAEISARRALQLEKSQNQLWHRHAILSRVLLLRGKVSYSLIEAREAVKLAPQQPQAYYYLALAEKGNFLYTEAIQSAQKVIELSTRDWDWGAKAQELIELINASL